MAKNYQIPRVPVWLSASRVFEIFGFITSMISLISFVIFFDVSDVSMKIKVKTFTGSSSMATVITVFIGGFIYVGEYYKTTWMSTATLSSSFGTCMVAGILHIICFILLVTTSNIQPLDLNQQWHGPVNAIGTNEFWDEILDHSTTPMYWVKFEGGYDVKKYLNLQETCETTQVSKQVFDAVKILTESTWDSKYAGIGADAHNINYKSIVVRDVKRVENVDLWDNYVHERKKIIGSLLRRGPFEKLEDRSTRGSILTSRYMNVELKKELYPELNEYLLFHGTKLALVDNIMKKGMDPRHASESTMMGRGNYCAESSTKSDQYADTSNQRQNVGLKMFLVRVLLGKIYVAISPHKYKLPPCMTCLTDGCINKQHEHFDSVVADIHGKIFREVIVYNSHQCYPESSHTTGYLNGLREMTEANWQFI
ncbi:uncharacterized protein LOC134258807 isoform X2 [Saccostrea cucullata]|uniref:uncharacterized protein LOC134258807 isoform X2 n=1 Tax=Saccostrea cuccullata TaxID=36930 RepID=UPI002ED108C7